MQINQAGDLESTRGNGDQGNWTGFGQTEKTCSAEFDQMWARRKKMNQK